MVLWSLPSTSNFHIATFYSLMGVSLGKGMRQRPRLPVHAFLLPYGSFYIANSEYTKTKMENVFLLPYGSFSR